MKQIINIGMLTALFGLGAGNAAASSRTYEITLTNLTQGVVLTPPIFALSKHEIVVFEPGTPASSALERLAEGGHSDELRTAWEEVGIQDVIQTTEAVMPGSTMTVQLKGTPSSRLNLASMLLPTNDGFVAVNGRRVANGFATRIIDLRAYDSGTELNDEVCTNIPGPQCAGAGFDEADGEGHVAPHAGIHGEGELSRRTYNWGNPVARITIRRID